MRSLTFTLVLLAAGCGDDDSGDGGGVDESRCVPERCNGVDDDCDGVIDDDFSFADDPTNCGACGVNCRVQNGAGVCAQSSCQRQVLSCDPFYGDCDADGVNGCEGDFLSNDHCGACNLPCMRANANASCAAGECELLSCRAGFGNCDSDDANGCEVNLTSSRAHCGACDSACTLENATASCDEGACAVAACSMGFGDCDEIAANGCETATTTAAHCGSCTTACAMGETCVDGTCTPGA